MRKRGLLYGAFLVLLFCFQGCGKEKILDQSLTSVSQGLGTREGVDLSERVNLNIYLMGDAPMDLSLIEKELNILALRDLNCTISFHFTTWSDYMQRYNLLLSAGQPMDLIYTSDWLYYNQYAKKGAFKALDDLLPVYAPDLCAFVPQSHWEAVRVNGRIHTVPSTYNEYVNEGFLYREDYRKKYDLPIPDSLENVERYLEGIKQHEPARILTAELVIDNGFGPFFSAMSVLNFKYHWVDMSMPYGLSADYDTPDKLWNYWDSDSFLEDMRMFKRWADKGFWTRGSLSNKNSTTDSFINAYSLAVMNGLNPVKYSNVVSLMKSKDPAVEIGYFPYCRVSRLVRPVHPIHNGMAIPHSSKHPGRALMFYEKLVLDREYHNLSHYGIENLHYRISPDGYYQMEGTVDSNGFAREAMNSWAWRNPNFLLFDRNFKLTLDLFEEFDEYSKPDIFFGFVEDYSSYQAERAALYQVQSQYLVPLQAGMVEDVERGVQVFLEQASAAGLERVQDEYSKQWLRYCKELGLYQH